MRSRTPIPPARYDRNSTVLVAAAGAMLAAVGGLALFSRSMAKRIEKAVPPDGRFLEVDGVRLHYREEGAGFPIVMIHGLGGQMRNFSYALTERLAREFRLILIDRPGSGYSEPLPAGRADVKAQAALVAGLLDALKLDRPLVVGHSLGGAVALALALDHADKVGALALIAPLTHREPRAPEAFKGLAIASAPLRRAFAWTLAAPMTTLVGHKSSQRVFAPDPVPADFPIRGGGALVARPGNFYAATGDLLAANDDMDDMTRRYPTMAIPTAIIFGRQDQVLSPAAHGEALAATAPDAQLTLIDGGHMIPVTHPDKVAAWLRTAAARVRR